ncbi:MFS transporter [Chondrinema litorale]|uniref:MFS transporter n=1 Tax=Chondrinema litorale TaxID=2994555 RepID=UPI002542C229|nr:MFS transporter [Chondrinema litorale]UZR92909.1 MFS transporter [Chondrinema litorale]
MEMKINRSRLFLGSCTALIVTAMTFAIRAGILEKLGVEFELSDTELGYITSMAFLGFPIAMIIGGPLYNTLGPKKIGYIAFFSHIIGLGLTMLSQGFWGLFVSTFFVGFANGMVEAAFNPLIADMFPEKKTTMLNRFHVWFPGGIVIGSLVSQVMSDMSWQSQIGVMLIPTLIYGIIFFGQKFPSHVSDISTSSATNLKAMMSPLYIFMILCMFLTATSELGTTQWVERLLGNAGAEPLLVLALVTGLMAVGRFFAGPIVHKLNPTGLLLASSVIAFIGIYLLSIAEGNMTYVAAIVFAIGVCYFWPTMIGFIAEYIPKSGAFGMSIMGGAGMFATSVFQPIIGSWLDSNREQAKALGLDGQAAELFAGQETLSNITILPAILIVAFAGLFFYIRMKKKKEVAATQTA